MSRGKKISGKRISRREFIKKSALALAGLGVGLYAIDKILAPPKKQPTVSEGSAPKELWKWSKEAYHYLPLGENVKCQLCPHGCLLKPDDRGVCRDRVNKGGKLYTLVYGNPCAVHVDPVEKKPLFHFLPGSTAFSIGTAGCNFRCLNCQNWQISQSSPEDTQNTDMPPAEVVSEALKYGSKSIAYTYNEPTSFYEYMTDTSKAAREKGLRNIMVTAGYINTEPLRELSKVIDGAHIDLKGFSENTYNELNGGTLQPVLDTIKTMKKQGVWFEIINLVVPTWTDDLNMISEMSEWLVETIGPNHPLHFSRFHPEYKLTHLPPTPVDILEKARDVALKKGLNYVYIGNVPGHEAENTFCPKCGGVVIGRRGYTVDFKNFENGACKKCGEKIVGVWE